MLFFVVVVIVVACRDCNGAQQTGFKTGSPPDFLWKSGGSTMSFKAGNFSFQACTAKNWLRMGKYGTYLELNASQGAPKHCQTFDSFIQF